MTCGCDGGAHGHEVAAAATRLIQLEKDILGRNNGHAERNRRWFSSRRILALNLVSSPGAGKTTILERTIREIGSELAIHVIEGDQETDNDAARIRAAGCPVIQLNTGTGCHLDAAMVERGLAQLAPPDHSLVVVENVGNLVCPALFDLGESSKVLVSAVTEGEDKPLKYPHMFRASRLVLLNKVDLLPYLSFDIDGFLENVRRVNPEATVLALSATRGDGFEEWCRWLRQARHASP